MAGQEIFDPGMTLQAEELIRLRQKLHLLPDKSAVVSALPGSFVIKKRGQGQDNTGSRLYAPGDDIRHMDRGATARTGELHVRTFREERDRVTFLVADFRPSMLWGMKRAFRSVAAAEVLAILGWHAVETGARVGLWAITAEGPVIVAARGRVRGQLDVIGGLVRAHAKATTPPIPFDSGVMLDRALTGLQRVAPKGAEIFIASGFDDPGDLLEDHLGDLGRRRHINLIEVIDGVAQSLPQGIYPMVDPQGRAIRANIGKNSAQSCQQSHAYGQNAVQIDATQPVDLTQLFGARG